MCLLVVYVADIIEPFVFVEYCRMSMDDSSCGFLGMCFGAVVAYMLGIGRAAWIEIGGVIRQKGPICIGMVSCATYYTY